MRLNTNGRQSTALPSRCCEPLCTEEILRYRHTCNTHARKVWTFEISFIFVFKKRPLEIPFAKTSFAERVQWQLREQREAQAAHKKIMKRIQLFTQAYVFSSALIRKKWVPRGFGYRKPAAALEEDGAFPAGAGGVRAQQFDRPQSEPLRALSWEAPREHA